MSAIAGIVAINTFREAVRDRVLYNLIVFALMMIGASILVGEISIGIDRLVIINLGLSAISIFGLVMAIFIGVGLVYKEMEKRTLYSVLAKPVRRWEFLVGKFGGLLLTLEHARVITPQQREIVIERMLALEADEPDTEQLKWVVLMVLSSQPGSELAVERLGGLVAELRTHAPH